MKKTVFLLIMLMLALALCPGYAAAEDAQRDLATRAFPVSAKRAVHVDNGHVKLIHIFTDGRDEPMVCFVVPDEDTAHIRLEISAADNPLTMVYEDCRGADMPVTDLLDQGRGAYVCDQPVEGGSGGEYHFSTGCLAERTPGGADPDEIRIFLIRDEKYIGEIKDSPILSGCQGFRWEYAEPGQAEERAPGAYTIRTADQDNNPVEGVYANFCTDTACTMVRSDENGLIVFDGEPDVYHVQLLKVPEGYSFDSGFELYTGREYGEWVLLIRKD